MASHDTEARRQARAIELFHLTFLEVASIQLRPIEAYAVKGGVNLRFFLGSRRRSADLDLDHVGRKFGAFAEQVDALFASRQLAELLRTRQLRLVAPRRSKDTDTVKRWKLSLAGPEMADAASKVEVSQRLASGQPVVGPVDDELARRLGGLAVRLQHYAPPVAIEQKVSALAGRSATEPRDVFDLDHLFRAFPDAVAQLRLDEGTTRAAIARALEIAYADYRALVVDYLDEDLVDLFSGEDAWADMVLRVTSRLEEAIGGPA